MTGAVWMSMMLVCSMHDMCVLLARSHGLLLFDLILDISSLRRD